MGLLSSVDIVFLDPLEVDSGESASAEEREWELARVSSLDPLPWVGGDLIEVRREEFAGAGLIDLL
jgi:hypothetical protein